MTTPRLGLAADHPFMRAAGKSPVELAADIMEYHRGRTGLFMGPPDPPEDPPNPDPTDTDPETLVRIDGREWKVRDLQRIAADEKRQGKRAGQRETLEALGVDDLDAAKALIAAAQDAARKDETEAQRKQREADESRVQADREKATAAEERRAAALERALVRRHVGDDDVDDAVTILAKHVPADADADAIAKAADDLKERRPELFGGTVTPPPNPAGELPGGAPRGKPRPSGQPFGAGGLARAERRWGKKGA